MINGNENYRKPSIRVLVIDDQKMMRALLKDYVGAPDDIEVVGLASNGKEGVEKVFALKPDVVVMDIEMPEMNGIDATLMLRNRKSSAKVLVVSNSYDDRYLAQALRNGANGYLLKTASPEELVTAIRGVNSGSLHFGSGVLKKEMSSLALGAKTENKVTTNSHIKSNGDRSFGDGGSITRADSSKLSTVESETPDKSISTRLPINGSSRSDKGNNKSDKPSSVQDLELELSRIRAGYWVLRTEQKTHLRQIRALWMGIAVSLSLTILLFFLVL